MKLRTIDDLDVARARVLVRADLNVPLADGSIGDDFRIRRSVPTITKLLERGAARVIVCSHLGRPKGEPDPRYRLGPVGTRLGELLDMEVPVVPLPPTELPETRVVLLENLRFHPGETTNDQGFARALADLADVYVDDAFGAVHRAHASVSAVAEMLPSAAGLLLVREVSALSKLLEAPEHPFVAVVGGAKVSDKLGVLSNLLRVADTLVIGGAMCFTFLRAQGHSTGTSLVEEERIDDCRLLLEQHGDRILLPSDVVIATEMKAGVQTEQVRIDAIPDDAAGYDIGKETSRAYVDAIRVAKTVLWNGPMGVFEIDEFASGTRAVAADVALGPAYSVVGGGDSVAALGEFGYTDKVDHVSTGGGAMLEFLEGKELPGLIPLRAGSGRDLEHTPRPPVT